MPNPIIELLSDTRPMSGPEILIHFPLAERRQRTRDLEELVARGEVIHVPMVEQQVRIAAFKLPEGSRCQRSIFDLDELG
ncbi:hypothetical protein [Endozoicomonas sp. ALC020]|uniref:hypothetical protein n=1 Tax=unclassified Endozoicomonas TaxID=2644528 RepID=UPI003BAEB4A6